MVIIFGQCKLVQYLLGGVVKYILVCDGQYVEVGELLICMELIQVWVNVDLLFNWYVNVWFNQVCLQVEYDGWWILEMFVGLVEQVLLLIFGECLELQWQLLYSCQIVLVNEFFVLWVNIEGLCVQFEGLCQIEGNQCL